ncbi:transcriptional regulator [Bifidobacterium adolescentis]|uniref:transcriptional regulator n=1 Tax=Bifidobacterium adolescentis TaxID=1680 RepID=UPI001EDBD25E|nr:transcriptional regulator [Bifidobacterium adolescentis]MCG4652427.1 transcriptional regulator [Bifidobacterium adolescentis]MCG4654074.1 transcriptional regulator [Bifidobacterium adolescentis]MCQ5024425.1 transcriptional regulator [Bifidobacterium adolescentis]
MQVTTINDQPTLLIDRPLTADTTPPAAVTDGMTTVTTTPPTPAMRHDAIPLAAIASWRTLLGIETDTEAVAAILHVRDHGEPDPDPQTGETAWTSAYNAIEKAINTTTAPADNATDDPLTAGRNKTRGLLGLPLLPDTATTNPSAEDETDAPTTIALPAGIESTELGNLLADHADDIANATDRFIDSLTRTDNGKEHD